MAPIAPKTRLIPIVALQKAGTRCDEYQLDYGVSAQWSITRWGLTLEAQYGRDKVERSIDWTELSDANDPEQAIKDIEKAALAGLSS